MKGQITLFIIIGVVVLVAFGLTFYVVSQTAKGVKGRPAEQVLEQTIIKPIDDYITTCLTLAANEGLELLGKQGGWLYQSGLPEVPEPAEGNYVVYNEYKVRYAIVPPEGNVGTTGREIFFSQPPEYPFPGFPWISSKEEPHFYGYYGVSKLPPLYKKNQTGGPVTSSIQEMLERFVEKSVVECADWKGFEAQELSFRTGNPSAELLFAETREALGTEQFISFKLNWTVEISPPTGEKTTLKEFSAKLPVRLARVYFAAKNLIDADVTDISLEPSSTEFVVSTLPAGEDDKDSIVILEHPYSTIAGKPYEFRIARKNRNPALWQIDKKEFDRAFHIAETKTTTFRVENNTLIVIDPCDDPVVIELNASDPDNNKVVFDIDKDEIPKGITPGMPFAIRVYARDAQDSASEDYQEITLGRIAICVPD